MGSGKETRRMGVNGRLCVCVYCVLFLPVLRHPSTICKQRTNLLSLSLSLHINRPGHCRIEAAHSPRDPTIDLMRSPTVRQTAAVDKHR